MAEWTIDELMCSAIAREVGDGDVVLEGIGAFLPTAAYELARLTHAPSLVSVSPIGSVFRTDPLALDLSRYEAATTAAGLRRFSYGDMALWYLPAYLPHARTHWKEFMRPAQVDRWGTTNNVLIGSHAQPRVRLPGAVGLPDGAPLERGIYMYVPRHDRRTFVERVDFVSTLGLRAPDPRPAGRTARPERLVSDLGVFAFDPDAGLTVVSLHPGVEPTTVRERTGFALDVPDAPERTPAPTDGELRLLREAIDPLGLRRLELVPRDERLALLRAIVTAGESADGAMARVEA